MKWKSCLFVAGALLLTVIVGASYLLWQAFYVPEEVRSLLSPNYTPPPKQEVEQRARVVEQRIREAIRIQEAMQSTPSASTPPAPVAPSPTEIPASPWFQVTVTQDELNILAQSRLQERFGERLRGLQVELKPERVAINGLANWEGRWLYVQTEGNLQVKGGSRLQFVPHDVRVGNLELPSAMTAQIQEELRQAGEQGVELPVEVQHLSVQDGRVVVWGRKKQKQKQ